MLFELFNFNKWAFVIVSNKSFLISKYRYCIDKVSIYRPSLPIKFVSAYLHQLIMAINLACTTPTVRCTLQLEGLPQGKNIKQALEVYGVEVERTRHLEDSRSSIGTIFVTIKASDESEYIYMIIAVHQIKYCAPTVFSMSLCDMLCTFIVWLQGMLLLLYMVKHHFILCTLNTCIDLHSFIVRTPFY